MLRLAGFALVLGPAVLAPEVRAVQDPLTGVWEGRGSGESELVPREGFSFHLELEARGEFEALVRLTLEDVPATGPAEAEFDPDTGELVFRANLQGIVIDFELVVAGETISGSARGLGVTVDLSGRRVSHELPAPEEAGPTSVADLERLTVEDWRVDLHALAEILSTRHPDPFFRFPRERWEDEVSSLDARLGDLSCAASAVQLARLVARLGDSHTFLGLQGAPFQRLFPIRLLWFADGVFVVAVDAQHAEALGLRVVRLGHRDIDEALAAIGSLFPSENEAWPRARAPGFLPVSAVLVALGLIDDEEHLPLVLEGVDGTPVEVVVEAPGTGAWVQAPDPRDPAPPSRQRADEAYWFQVLDGGAGVYWAYNRCAEDPAHPMRAFVEQVLTALDTCRERRLVIDLRNNSGGNSAVLASILPRLREGLGPEGAVWALIGPRTFSSGMRNALELRAIGARLAGTPTGGKPNAHGEVKLLRLPRSGLPLQYSTKHFVQVDGDPPSVVPDLLVPTESADTFAGRDPVLERVLREPVASVEQMTGEARPR